MASINQAPSGQTSVAISIAPLDGIGIGTVNPSRVSTARTQEGAFGMATPINNGGQVITQTLIPASLRGRNTIVSPTEASGVFTLEDQVAARRADAWPS